MVTMNFLQPSTASLSTIKVRKTIKNSGFVEGHGLHSGEKTRLIFHPAEEGTGIVFWRRNSPVSKLLIPAHPCHVMDTSLATTIGLDGEYIQTIEHLMFALFVLGITDIFLEMQGGREVPILDGSARDFVAILKSLEFHELESRLEAIQLQKPVMVTDGNRYIVALPSNEFKISYTVDYPHPLLRSQTVELIYEENLFQNKVASARTFGFLKDVEEMRRRGLALGGSLENALVFTPDGVLNEMRFDQEAVYHKILDLVGDLSLVGRPISAHILACRAGHALDVAFTKKLLGQLGQETLMEAYPVFGV
ncbi:MAG: UDP-3-O-acyl-N-acetylglucosamine deacetylase [Leptospiraceae bacterium]|nr:UDP-3-O-acyl-N-acetylglucosamine deacetylase [Leptospiraceae bacterium]MDW8306766.1 UDP-3-O-acyl-N-acetylglucosamine deacetylase [Leptospiraceae bacterium]